MSLEKQVALSGSVSARKALSCRSKETQLADIGVDVFLPTRSLEWAVPKGS
jgi:hypothetical protein